MNDTIDNILNVLLKEDLIELPPIVVPKFPNGVPKTFRYEEFCNYHRVPGHITCNCGTLRHIIHDFIDKKAIKMDGEATKEHGLVHPDNGKLGVFTNPLPPSQPRGCIGMVSTSNELHYYFTHNKKCRHDSPNKLGNGVKTNTASGVHNYSYGAKGMQNIKLKVSLFFPASIKCI